MIGKREHDAIEAAAQALFGFNKENNLVGWDIVPEEVREYHRECAEDAVVAALAYLGFDELYFSARIGFDENVPLSNLVHPIIEALALAEEHKECVVGCLTCDENTQLRSTIARVQALAEESGASTKRRILDALEGRTYGKRFG